MGGMDSVSESGSGSSLRLLLVEDQELESRLYRTMLQQYVGDGKGGSGRSSRDVTVETAGDLTSARSSLEDASDPFDLVILDLNLPDSSGLDTLEAVLEAAPERPVVVLTGTDDTRLGQRALERGAQDYLVKSHVTPRLLAQTATYAIERRQRTALLERQRRELAVLHWLVYHGIRDDAGVILGWAAELEPATPAEERIVSQLVDAGEHIVELTDSVDLAVTTIEESNPALRSVDLGTVLEEERERVEARRDDVRVTIDRPEGPIPVRADENLNILVRSVLSAVDGVEETGNERTLPVSVSVPDPNADRVEVAVVDDVTAVPVGSLDTATDEVAQNVDATVRLHVVKQFVERYDGSVELTGREDGRTAIVVSLPLASAGES
ncbi:response regulator [Natrarchaeobaculum aegyptiacum]|uniref:Response regulatory domain-containing protein n=1 Tax=Natrarchaeobaculum aegyptiacum TaxID=745377 RepID=A0A2Z2I0I4_9EURY|nr:response regulator [Natrarchaeobaculum aegyptiacum]ARS89678.1 hypothetical protein B1756_07940 [Natrarchaeobaculum aegyptiacum]